MKIILNFIFHPTKLFFTTALLLCGVFILISFSRKKEERKTDSIYGGDTIYFSGYKWLAKDSYNVHTGPGHNYYSALKDNIWVDDKGRLHLKMTHKNGRWYCAEVRMTQSLGYGEYTFHIEKNPAKLDKNLVIGFFTYDHDDPANFHKEIDIEFGQWGQENNLNTQFVVQPFTDKKNIYRFDTNLNKDTKQVFQWKKKGVCFAGFYEGFDTAGCYQVKYAQTVLKPQKIFLKDDEKTIINMWLYKSDYPSDYTDYEMIVSKFEFKAYKYEKFCPSF